MIRTAAGGALLILAFAAAAPASAATADRDAVRRARPHITIYPRNDYPGPYAKRHCQSWLAKEYRVSGPVIVPQMRCWWQ